MRRTSVDACGAGGAAGSAGSVACRPGAGMILSVVVCAFNSSGESGVSENLNFAEPIHNSGAVFVVALLSRQLSSTVDSGSSVSGILFLVDKSCWCQVRKKLSSYTCELCGVRWLRG